MVLCSISCASRHSAFVLQRLPDSAWLCSSPMLRGRCCRVYEGCASKSLSRRTKGKPETFIGHSQSARWFVLLRSIHQSHQSCLHPKMEVPLFYASRAEAAFFALETRQRGPRESRRVGKNSTYYEEVYKCRLETLEGRQDNTLVHYLPAYPYTHRGLFLFKHNKFQSSFTRLYCLTRTHILLHAHHYIASRIIRDATRPHSKHTSYTLYAHDVVVPTIHAPRELLPHRTRSATCVLRVPPVSARHSCHVRRARRWPRGRPCATAADKPGQRCHRYHQEDDGREVGG